MVNGATLIVLIFVIACEAAQRLVHPEPAQGGVVIVSALVGVGVNGYVAFSFRAQGSNLNIRAAVLHAMGDLLASIGVIAAGIVILLTGWLYADPLVSVLIAALIGWNAFKIVGETVNILLEGTPRGTDLSAIRREISAVDGVTALHDLHVWSISSEHQALSVHVVVEDQSLADSEHVMREVESRLCEKFAIGHTTVQVEFCHPARRMLTIWLSTTILIPGWPGSPPRSVDELHFPEQLTPRQASGAMHVQPASRLGEIFA